MMTDNDMKLFVDSYRRVINYMRISVTDRCNLRCIYCMPSEGVKAIKHSDILSYEDIIRIVSIASGLGVSKIRLTGGEPLLRKNLVYLISSINHIQGIKDLSLTTNGLLLKQFAKQLASAGLNRVNISLDSLDPIRYKEITRGGNIDQVLQGIEEAERYGLTPIKINMVPVRGFNDEEINRFASLTIEKPYYIRFIEFMPIGAKDFWSMERYISTDEIKDKVSAIGQLLPVKFNQSGPAKYFRFDNAKGLIGFISPVSEHFCQSCNRLRLTADGKIRPCLFSETEIDIKSAIRYGASDDEISRLLKLSVEIKPSGHEIEKGKNFDYLKPISKIGG